MAASPGSRRRCPCPDPGVQVLVHPECLHEVVLKADLIGSTEFIIKTIEKAPAGSRWAVGTELNLVKRLALTHPDQEIVFLEKHVCYCATMNRIDLPHLVWALENGCRASSTRLSDSETEHTPGRRCNGCSRQARLRRTSFATGRVGDQALVGVAQQSPNVLDRRVCVRQDQVRVAQLIVGHHRAAVLRTRFSKACRALASLS